MIQLYDVSVLEPHPHHMTLDGYLTAVQQGCYVCTSTWREVQVSRDIENTWKPLSYTIHKFEDDEYVLTLIFPGAMLPDEQYLFQSCYTFWFYPLEG